MTYHCRAVPRRSGAMSGAARLRHPLGRPVADGVRARTSRPAAPTRSAPTLAGALIGRHRTRVARFNRNLVGAPVSPVLRGRRAHQPLGPTTRWRTGNVRPCAARPVRRKRRSCLIDTWRSPTGSLHTARARRDSVLPEGAPRPGSVVGRRQVCRVRPRPRDPARLGILSRLLDELSLPRGERGPVVRCRQSRRRGPVGGVPSRI